MESIASWVAPIATTIAALMTASNLGSRVTGYGFVVFTIGSIAWAALGIATGQPNLLWQNVILTGLNLFGHAQDLVINVDSITFNVPEPASAAVIAMAIGCLGLSRRRRI